MFMFFLFYICDLHITFSNVYNKYNESKSQTVEPILFKCWKCGRITVFLAPLVRMALHTHLVHDLFY